MKCELCTMTGIRAVTTNGVTKYYCEHHVPNTTAITTTNSQLKKLAPLLSIFAVIGLLTIATGYAMGDLSFMGLMMYMMAYFFLVFGVFKVFNLRAFADAYQTYDVIASRSRAYALAYPFIEIALGLLYLFWIGGLWRDVTASVLMIIGTIGVWRALQKKDEIPCACLGMIFSVPMTHVTLFENVLMALMAVYMVLMSMMGMPM